MVVQYIMFKLPEYQPLCLAYSVVVVVDFFPGSGSRIGTLTGKCLWEASSVTEWFGNLSAINDHLC